MRTRAFRRARSISSRPWLDTGFINNPNITPASAFSQPAGEINSELRREILPNLVAMYLKQQVLHDLEVVDRLFLTAEDNGRCNGLEEAD